MEDIDIINKLKADKIDIKDAYTILLRKNSLLEEKVRFFMNEVENQKAYANSISRKSDLEINRILNGAIQTVRESGFERSEAIIEQLSSLSPVFVADSGRSE